MAKSTTTGRSRFTILPSIVRLRRVPAGISGWPSWRLVPGVRGYLVIPRLRAVTPSAQSRMRAKSGTTTTLLDALWRAGYHHILCGDYAAANAPLDELIGLADERGAPYWKALGTAVRGWLFALTGKASDAVRAITSGMSGIASLRSTGATFYEPQHLQYLAMAYAELGQLDDAWRCIDDAIDKIEKSKEKWGEAEVHRIAGEIAVKSPEPDRSKSRSVFRARARGRPPTTSQILGTPRRHEPRAPLARPGQACSKRANCSLRFTGGSLRGSTRAI